MSPKKIFKKGVYIGGEINQYNSQTKQLIQKLNLILNFNIDTGSKLIQQIKPDIYITAMTEHHNSDNCVDLTTFPRYAMLLLYDLLQDNNNKVYISTYNKHIHYQYSPNTGGGSVEVLQKNGIEWKPTGYIEKSYSGKVNTSDIKLSNFYSYSNYLFYWYGLIPTRIYEKNDTPAKKITRPIIEYFNKSYNNFSDYYYKKLPDFFETSKQLPSEIYQDVKKISNFSLITGGIILAGIIFILINRKR